MAGATFNRRLLLSGLLRAIAIVPIGEKLNIRALREPLGLSQEQAIALVEELIAEGRLDKQTLRPPAARKLLPAKEFRPTGDSLYRLVLAEIERRGITKKAASLQLFGQPSQLASMRGSVSRSAASKTIRKVEAWLADSAQLPAAEDAAPEEPESVQSRSPAQAPSTDCPPTADDTTRGSAAALARLDASAPAKSETGPVGQPASSPAPVSRLDLLDEIGRFCARHSVSATRFGKLAANDASLVRRLKSGSEPSRKTVERVRGFIANPPSSGLQVQHGGARRRSDASAAPPRDLTREPVTPLLDLGDRQRLNGQRHAAQVRREQEEAAAEKLDAGIAPSNSFEKALMNNIRRRRADESRAADPVEIAKLALRRRGRVVFNCSVTGGRADRFTVSGCRDEETGKNVQFDRDGLIELARRINPTAMTAAAA